MGSVAPTPDAIITKVIDLAMKVHSELGMGFKEAIYANALAFEFAEAGMAFEREKRIPVFYRDHIMGDFVADLVMENVVVVELKAVEVLNSAHSVQIVNYLCGTRLDYGLLLNFGAKSLQFKTKVRDYPSKNNPVNLV
jgi:GxxExxY protein